MPSTESKLLEEMLQWMKFMGMQEARGVAEDALSFDDEEKERAARITYELTNGENSTKDIGSYIPFTYRWVSSRHQEWATVGLVEKTGPQGSYEYILSLEELGMEAPEIPEPDEE